MTLQAAKLPEIGATNWEQAFDRWSDAEMAAAESRDDLMAMPAPDLSALWWKLQRLLEIEEDGYTASLGASYVKPTLDDCKRLLQSTGLRRMSERRLDASAIAIG